MNESGLEGVDVLTCLGLSYRQARVYLALLKTGDAKAKTIAEYAQVERQEVYKLIEELKLKGLIEQKLKVPTSYTATPLDQAIVLMLEHKSDDLILLTKKATKLVTKLTQTQNSNNGIIMQPCFGTISEGSRGKKYLHAIEETQQSIDMVASWTRFKQQSFRFENLFIAKLKKGINLRFIIEKPTNNKLPKWIEVTKEKYSNFEIRTHPSSTAVAIAIFDKDKAAIVYDAQANLNEGPDLWTAHPPLIVLCKNYFDVMWNQAINS